MKLAPNVSGNKINGLDDKKVTKPKVVYWANEPNEIPHGEMQKWFYTVDPCLPDFAQERKKRSEIQNMQLPPISAKVSEYNSDVWSEKLDKFVTDGICEKIGVAELDQAWVFEGYSATQSRDCYNWCSA